MHRRASSCLVCCKTAPAATCLYLARPTATLLWCSRRGCCVWLFVVLPLCQWPTQPFLIPRAGPRLAPGLAVSRYSRAARSGLTKLLRAACRAAIPASSLASGPPLPAVGRAWRRPAPQVPWPRRLLWLGTPVRGWRPGSVCPPPAIAEPAAPDIHVGGHLRGRKERWGYCGGRAWHACTLVLPLSALSRRPTPYLLPLPCRLSCHLLAALWDRLSRIVG